MIAGAWREALIDIDRATEFTGDDVDRYSKLVDLGMDFEFLTVFIPTITSTTVRPYVQRDNAIATVPVAVSALDDDATGSFAHANTASVGDEVITYRIGGCQYVRLYSGANQAADRTLTIRGFNRS